MLSSDPLQNSNIKYRSVCISDLLSMVHLNALTKPVPYYSYIFCECSVHLIPYKLTFLSQGITGMH